MEPANARFESCPIPDLDRRYGVPFEMRPFETRSPAIRNADARISCRPTQTPTEALHPARERKIVLRLSDEMNVIQQNRKMHDMKAELLRTSRGGLNYFKDLARPKIELQLQLPQFQRQM